MVELVGGGSVVSGVYFVQFFFFNTDWIIILNGRKRKNTSKVIHQSLVLFDMLNVILNHRKSLSKL